MSKTLILPIKPEDVSKFVYFMREHYFKGKEFSSASINIMLDNAEYIQFKKDINKKIDNFFLINKEQFLNFVDEMVDKGVIDESDLAKLLKTEQDKND